MTNDKTNSYNLEERTAKFGEEVIKFISTLEKIRIVQPLTGQLIRSATSIGANYMEADAAESRKDFQHKISICKKESKETLHWLRMVAVAVPGKAAECRKLWQEAHELALIFSKIVSTTRNNK